MIIGIQEYRIQEYIYIYIYIYIIGIQELLSHLGIKLPQRKLLEYYITSYELEYHIRLYELANSPQVREREREQKSVRVRIRVRAGCKMHARLGDDKSTANLSTTILDFRGFDSSRILIVRGGIPRPVGSFQESLSQGVLSREWGRAAAVGSSGMWGLRMWGLKMIIY